MGRDEPFVFSRTGRSSYDWLRNCVALPFGKGALGKYALPGLRTGESLQLCKPLDNRDPLNDMVMPHPTSNMSHPSLLSYIRRVRSVRSQGVTTPSSLVLGGRSRDQVVCNPSAGPTRTIWEEAKRKPSGTAANAGTFGQSLCTVLALVVIIDDAGVAPPNMQESDAPKRLLVQLCPHNNQSHVTLQSAPLRMLVLEIGPTVKLP
jgi:hypothetical protein